MHILAALLITLAIVANANAQTLPDVGRTYDIAEQDALSELESHASKFDWQKEIKKVKPESYHPEDLPVLPVALKQRTFIVDPTYTLTQDIPDQNGGILYPSGYRFNPLDYISYSKTIVFINGTSKDQVQWFFESPYAHKTDVVLLLIDGQALKMGKQLSRPVFFASQKITQRFQLAAVPSVVKTSGRMFEVTEFPPKKAKKGVL